MGNKTYIKMFKPLHSDNCITLWSEKLNQKMFIYFADAIEVPKNITNLRNKKAFINWFSSNSDKYYLQRGKKTHNFTLKLS